MDLESIRQEIDNIDKEIVGLLEKRMNLVNQVATYKKKTGKAVLDTSREEAVLAKVAAQVKNKNYTETIQDTFKDIMTQSRSYQRKQLES